MRLAVLSIHSSPLGRAGSKDTGGMSTYLRGLSTALGQRGHRVDLFTRGSGSARNEIIGVAPNVRLVCPGDGLGRLDKTELYPHCPAVAESIDRFSRLDGGGGYDCIFSHYWLSGVVGRILQERWNIPHLLMFHTLGQAKNEACPGENEPRLRLETEAELARDCDLHVAAAERERGRIVEYYDLEREKVILVPSGIDRSLFYPFNQAGCLEAKQWAGGRPEGKTILAVGRIEPVKGFDLLLEAASLLPAEDDFEIIIAGGDHKSRVLTAALKEKAGALGLGGKINFAGVVEYDRLPVYYNAADVTVLPSYYESFGLVALESAACGTPVVASPVGVLPELVARDGACGTLVGERDPVKWAAAIRRAYTSKGRKSSRDLDAVLAPYSWPEAAVKLELALRSL